MIILGRGWGGGGLTNERPGSDHVIWGPMRGLEKNCTRWRKQTHRHTDMATLWPTRPSGAELVKIIVTLESESEQGPCVRETLNLSVRANSSTKTKFVLPFFIKLLIGHLSFVTDTPVTGIATYILRVTSSFSSWQNSTILQTFSKYRN